MTETSTETRLSTIEQRINSMETSITCSLERAISKILGRESSETITSRKTQLPGGELAGRDNE